MGRVTKDMGPLPNFPCVSFATARGNLVCGHKPGRNGYLGHRIRINK